MATDIEPEETKVSDRGMVTVPAHIRDRLDIEPGDAFRWRVTSEDKLVVEITRNRPGAFDDFEAVALGGDSLRSHDLAGADSSE